ncbi:MAG TPA: type II CAAX endopeptidase family protein [Caulobacteraceae bacterium]
MSERGVVAGLADSAFLAGLGARDKSPWRIALTLVGGLVVGAIAALAGFILAWTIYMVLTGYWREGLAGLQHVAVALKAADGKDLKSALLVMVTAVTTNGPFALAFVGLASILAGHRFWDYVSAAPAVRWRLLLAGLVLSVIVVAPVMAVDRLFSPQAITAPFLAVSPKAAGRAIYILAAIALLIPAAAAEEIIFRGWLLRQLAAFSRSPAILIVTTGVLFSVVHLLPEHATFSSFLSDLARNIVANPGALLDRTLMGGGFAYMTLRLGGIEFSTGAHAANNILIVLFIEPLTLKTVASAGDLSMASLLEDVALVLGYILITEAVARIAPLRRWTGVQAAEISSPTLGAASIG